MRRVLGRRRVRRRDAHDAEPVVYHPGKEGATRAEEMDWTDEQIIEAVAHLALAEFQSLIGERGRPPPGSVRPLDPPLRRLGGLGGGTRRGAGQWIGADRTFSVIFTLSASAAAWVRSQSRPYHLTSEERSQRGGDFRRRRHRLVEGGAGRLHVVGGDDEPALAKLTRSV